MSVVMKIVIEILVQYSTLAASPLASRGFAPRGDKKLRRNSLKVQGNLQQKKKKKKGGEDFFVLA